MLMGLFCPDGLQGMVRHGIFWLGSRREQLPENSLNG